MKEVSTILARNEGTILNCIKTGDWKLEYGYGKNKNDGKVQQNSPYYAAKYHNDYE